jgi:metallophosphoesterase superfamily enzyme
VVVFRHIADPAATGEISGHYHPKARLRTRAGSITRRCFLLDDRRMILPAYGTYTGGLFCDAPELDGMMAKGRRRSFWARRLLPCRCRAPGNRPADCRSAR